MSNAAKALENHDECQLFEAGQFGDHDPMALELCGTYFGLQGRDA